MWAVPAIIYGSGLKLTGGLGNADFRTSASFAFIVVATSPSEFFKAGVVLNS